MMLLMVAALGQNLPLPPMPYEYNALEPHIDEATMKVHHLKHHQTYTDKLNGALAEMRASETLKYLAKMGVDTLLQHLEEVPDGKLRNTVRNAGGGYVNHEVFFRTMSPNGGGEPEGLLLDGLKKAFGTFAAFKQMFTLAALEVFGSGWAWLYYDEKLSALAVTSTPNQDTPAMEEGVVSLLGIDVWEHAYYLKHQSNRKAYIDAWFNVVNWAEVLDTYIAATGEAKAVDDKEEV